VDAKVEHDRLEPGLSEPLMMAPLDPVHMGGREQAMEQDHWPPLAGPMDG
jgi:hypothetical protein